MKSRQERMDYILKYPEQLDKSLAKKIPGYLWTNGLQNTLAFLKEIEWKNDAITDSQNNSNENKSEKSSKNSIHKKNMFQFFSNYITNELEMSEQKDNKKVLPTDNLTYMLCHKAVFALSLDMVRMVPYLAKKEQKKDTMAVTKVKPVEKVKIERDKCNDSIQGKDIKNKYYLFHKCYGEKDLTGYDEEEETAFLLYKQSQKNINAMYKHMKYEKYEGVFSSRAGSRLILGMGETSVKEISFHMNSFYALPEITSTAIKGVFHHYCEEYGKENEMDSDILEEWFGTEEKEGNIIFLSCIPEKYKLEKDVMNSHYSEYYEMEVPKNSTEKGELETNKSPEKTNFKKEEFPKITNPKPLKFYAVNVEEIKIVFFYKKGMDENGTVKVADMFRKCMENCNLGAKGAVGYGYFQEKRSEH